MSFRLACLVFVIQEKLHKQVNQGTDQAQTKTVYMQDGASSHTSKLAKLALKDVRVVNWPAKSPDLNPIERLWNVLKGRIDVDLYATPDELHNAVIAAWDSITQEEINALVLTFHSSVRKMIAAEGKA